MKVIDARLNKGFEVQFYNSQGDSIYAISCRDTDEVAHCLAQWCWARVNGNCPTVWLDGKKWRG